MNKRLMAVGLLIIFGTSAMFGNSVCYAQENVKVVQVLVSGNQNINADAINSALTIKSGDTYSEDEVNKNISAITALGYFSAVTSRKEEIAGGVNITFEVVENPKVSEIKILDSYPVTELKIMSLMKSKVGQVLNVNTLNQDFQAIQSYYTDSGYFAFVTEDMSIDPKTGVLTVPILVHKIETIEITGSKKTKPYVFLREMKSGKGKIFNARMLDDDYMKVYALDILEEIKMYQITPGTKPGLLKVAVPVVEKKTGQVSLGLGYSSRQRLVGQIRLAETNFRGTGQGVNLLWEQGTSDAVGGSSSYELGFYEPWLDSRHTSLNVNYFNKIQYRFSSGVFSGTSLSSDKTYNERRKGGDVTLSRPLNDHLRLFLGARAENVDTDPSLLTGTGDLSKIVQKGDVLVGSLKAVNDSRDYPLDPAVGKYDSVQFEFGKVNAVRFGDSPTFNEIPFDGTFNKLTVDIRRYFSKGGAKTKPKDKRDTLAMRLRFGFAAGNLPFFEQFFVGGSESLRGYKEDRFWGKKMLLTSVEYRKPITDAFSGVLFVDYGDAWGGADEFKIGEFKQGNKFDGNFGGGFGVRVVTPIGHLRLDYGVGKEGSRTHFSMGQAF